jgi:hypothetical protein
MNGLRGAIRGALREAFPDAKPKRRTRFVRQPPEDNRYITFVGAIGEIASMADFDAGYLAAFQRKFPTLIEHERNSAEEAIRPITQFLAALNEKELKQ